MGKGWVSSLQLYATSNTLSARYQRKVNTVHSISTNYQFTPLQCLPYNLHNFIPYLCHCQKQDKCFTDSSEIVQRFRILVQLVIRQVWPSSNGEGKGQNYCLEEVEEKPEPVWIMVTTLIQLDMYQVRGPRFIYTQKHTTTTDEPAISIWPPHMLSKQGGCQA